MSLLLLSGGPCAAGATTHTVVVDATSFQPATITVEPGDRVVWVNRDPFPHTATAVDHSFDSGTIPAGGTWAWLPRQRGSFEYTCTFHPTMKGRLVVGESRRTP